MITNKGGDGWFGILEACRSLGKGGRSFTSADLVGSIPAAGDLSTKAQIASGWLGKFAKWGYLERGEPIKNEGHAGRPMSTYTLTKLGLTCTERPGRLTRLLKHIRALKDARGTKQETALYGELFDLAQEVEENKAGER